MATKETQKIKKQIQRRIKFILTKGNMDDFLNIADYLDDWASNLKER
tara:strand:- start:5082 stop:5222 length:141 start_codon:yes stop_codon:yes gene_type:complete